MALDCSFEPDPKKGGSYYRRLEDIPRALTKFEVIALPPNFARAIRRLLFRGREAGEGDCRYQKIPASRCCFWWTAVHSHSTKANKAGSARDEAHDFRP